MRKTRNSTPYEMIRTIYPVGLGAFCIERFYKADDKSVVFDMMYDCGSLSGKKKDIYAEVQNLYQNKPINLVCISHFDDDHINVFKKLIGSPILQPGRTTILMPQIVGNAILEQVGVDMFVNYQELRDDLEEAKLKVVEVLPMGEDGERVEDYSTDVENLKETISSGTRISAASCDGVWEYIPFNNFTPKHNEQLLNDIMQLTQFSDTKIQEIHRGIFNAQDIAVLKQAYQQLKLGKNPRKVSVINRNSLQLLSKAADDIHSGAYILYYPIWNQNIVSPICPAINSSCMYTGDSIMDQKMETVRKKYLGDERLGLFQIPHHGSMPCYDQNVINNLYFQVAFVNTDLNEPRLHIAPEIMNWQNYLPSLFMALKGIGVICEYIY